jgi:hypothetical protein
VGIEKVTSLGKSTIGQGKINGREDYQSGKTKKTMNRGRYRRKEKKIVLKIYICLVQCRSDRYNLNGKEGNL